MTWVSTKWELRQGGLHEMDVDHPVCIEQVRQRDGTKLYAVRQAGFCLDKEGDWVYEPMPSSRTDEFLESCRYNSWVDAAQAVEKFVKDSRGLFTPKVKSNVE